MTPAQLAKINALVVEKAMGRRLATHTNHTDRYSMYVDPDGLVWSRSGIVPFRATENIYDAWQVVEKMQDDGWGFEIRYTKGHCLVQVFDRTATDYKGYIHQSAPIAICLAALRAVGVDVKNEIGQ